MKPTLPILALALALGACGDHSRVDVADGEKQPAIVPDRVDRPDGGLATPTPPDIMEPNQPQVPGVVVPPDSAGVAAAPR